MTLTLNQCIIEKARASGPCSIDGFLFEVRTQLNEHASRDMIAVAVGKLEEEGKLELYEQYDENADPVWEVAEPSTSIKLTAEHQALLKLACQGMYLANGATDQRMAAQTGCYGGFYMAYTQLIRELFPYEPAWGIINRANPDMTDVQGFPQQIAEFVDYYCDCKVILL